jgi:hypothetical protein
MCSGRPSGASSEPGAASDRRLTLYRRAARALNRFCGRWTAPFCSACLEVTALHHRPDPRADVELLAGVFPGCCHAGVADALWVPGTGEEGRFPPEMVRAVARERGASALPGEPPTYEVRERRSGLAVTGVACAHLGSRGCRLGELKAPLCLCYACEPILRALGDALGGGDAPGGARGSAASTGAAGPLGEGTDDFAGARGVLRAAVSGPFSEAEAEVSALEARLAALDRALGERVGSGERLFILWRREKGAGAAEGQGLRDGLTLGGKGERTGT